MEIDRNQYEENENIEQWKKEKILSIGDLINKKPVKENKRIKNSKDALVDEIFNYFSKQISFPRIRDWVNKNGEQCIREVFEETKKKGIGLFIWSVGKNSTKFK